MRGAQRRPLFSRRHNHMFYGSVSLDRDILACQDHLAIGSPQKCDIRKSQSTSFRDVRARDAARIRGRRRKPRIRASRSTRLRIRRFVILGRPTCLQAYTAVLSPFKEVRDRKTVRMLRSRLGTQIGCFQHCLEIPMQSRLL